MATAIVLLKIDHKRVTGTAETILDIPDVTEVYSISGRPSCAGVMHAASHAFPSLTFQP